MSRTFPKRLAAVAMSAAAVALCAAPAAARPRSSGGSSGGSSSTGADISYPQCGGAYPTGQAFGIAGVTGGRVFSQNGCFAGELAWAAATPKGGSLYMNTADPSTVSPEWMNPTLNAEKFPDYTVTPPPNGYKTCDTTYDAGYGCDWDYGWNSAQYAYQQAVAAVSTSGVAPAALAGMRWWLDVETANSWTINDSSATWNATAADYADLQGAMAGLQYAQQSYDTTSKMTVAMPTIGVYTNSSSWNSIIGGAGSFPNNPLWLPGARTERGAQNNCGATSYTGGEIMLTQWVSSYDYDYPCPKLTDQTY